VSPQNQALDNSDDSPDFTSASTGAWVKAGFNLNKLGTFGVLGLLYGPLVVTFFMTMAELYEQHYRPRIMRRFKRLTVS